MCTIPGATTTSRVYVPQPFLYILPLSVCPHRLLYTLTIFRVGIEVEERHKHQQGWGRKQGRNTLHTHTQRVQTE